MSLSIKECWLSPYGQVVYTNGEWLHATKAAKILFEMYNNGKWKDIEDVWVEYKTPTEQLEELGWVRYSTITNEWVIHTNTKLTTDQMNKMFTLTGWLKTY